jgi:UDP-perosamine 4-acetyltransferase
MPADVIVIGAGGHARVVIDALQRSGVTVLGVCDPTLSSGSAGPLGVPCLGSDAALESYDRSAVLLVNGIGSIGDPALRITVYQRMTAAGWKFYSLVHPKAVIGTECTIASGAQIMAGAILQPGTHVGENAIVNTAASIDHDCRIGDHAHIAPGAVLCGNVVIGTGAHIGSGAVIVQGLTVGAHALIGAGVTVTRPVAEDARLTLHTIAAEIPIREKTP